MSFKKLFNITMLIPTLVIALTTSFSLLSAEVFHFKKLNNFGKNPGKLTASYLLPKNKQQVTALVVLLHGCAQNGEELADQSGFSELANHYGFVLLLPQQSSDNNVKTCFNWFSNGDTARDFGESLSLKNMILTLKKQTLTTKIYIAGLSAGGAMTNVMLVNYPGIFTAGAVVAGIPYPCADGIIKAISCMRSGPSQNALELANLAKKQNKKLTHWPKLVVITGSKDKVVNPKNSQLLAQQWSELMQLKDHSIEVKKGYRAAQWKDPKGNIQVELVEVDNIGHGMSVNPAVKMGGTEAPFLLKTTLSAAKYITNFWGLVK